MFWQKKKYLVRIKGRNQLLLIEMTASGIPEPEANKQALSGHRAVKSLGINV